MDKAKVLHLLDTVQKVLPYIVTQEVACHGLKCRELVCSSCSTNFEDDVEKSRVAYINLLKACEEVKSEFQQGTD